MKYLLKNLGILMIVAAVVLLGIYATEELIQNTYLIISLALLIGGLFVHILTNKHTKE